MKLIFGVIIFLLSNHANSALITFEEYSIPPGSITTQGDITSKGYYFYSAPIIIGGSHTHFVNNWGGGDSGSTFLGTDNFLNTETRLYMYREDREAFNLSSLDLGSYNDGSSILRLTGHLSDGSSISTDIALGDFSTYILGWNNLSRVEFDSLAGNGYQHYGIDNIDVSAVPVPAAAWLFGTALIGSIGLHKRREAA